MKVFLIVGLISFFNVVILGCGLRTYSVSRERVDQDLTTGNKGYIQGIPKSEATRERKLSRQTQVFEIELGPPAEVVKKSKGNKGVIQSKQDSSLSLPETTSTVEVSKATKTYEVQKGDTLQKISEKFYGTTKNWYKIYKANQDRLSGPDKIYPGQVINIPAQ